MRGGEDKPLVKVDTVYRRLLKKVAAVCGTTMSSLHVTSVEGNQLLLEAVEGLDDLWRDWTREIPIRTGIGAGVCGEAVALKRVSIAANLEDPKFEGFRRIAHVVGVGAAWSMPLLSDDGIVLGALSTFYRHPRSPTDQEIRMVARIAAQYVWVLRSRRRRPVAERPAASRIADVRESLLPRAH